MMLLQVFARALIGQVEQRHRLRPVVPIAEAEVHPPVGGLPQWTRLRTLASADRAPRPAPFLVDRRNAPGIDGMRERFELAHIN